MAVCDWFNDKCSDCGITQNEWLENLKEGGSIVTFIEEDGQKQYKYVCPICKTKYLDH